MIPNSIYAQDYLPYIVIDLLQRFQVENARLRSLTASL